MKVYQLLIELLKMPLGADVHLAKDGNAEPIEKIQLSSKSQVLLGGRSFFVVSRIEWPNSPSD